MEIQVLSSSSHFLTPEVLSEGACKAPSGAALYANRISRSLDEKVIPDSRNDAPEQLLLPPAKTFGNDHHSPTSRLAICGFLPLPPILASPICTPTPSTSLHKPVNSQGTPEESEKYTTTPSSPNRVSLRVLFSTPTWISTPPTPPSKLTRRSSACLSRRVPTSPFSPSASFPGSMHNRQVSNNRIGMRCLKRCTSVPVMIERARAFPEPSNLLDESDRATSHSSLGFYMCSPDFLETNDEETSSRVKAIFHLPQHNMDNEDEAIPFGSGTLDDGTNPDGSWSDRSPEDVWERERDKDVLRKYHALKELCSTEVGYLISLKAFVTIYLRNLPTLAQRIPNSTFGRASASFTTGPWINSYTQLQAAALSSSLTLPDTNCPQSSAISSAKDVPKSNIRYLFTDSEIELLTRNAEEILQLHEHFVREISVVLEPLGFTMNHSDDQPVAEDIENLDEAIRAVSAKFATEASRFNAYQSFCAGHPAALDLIRKISQQYPLEWESYEQRCTVMVSDILDGGKVTDSEPKFDPQDQANNYQTSIVTEDRTRTLSLTSLDGAVRSLRLRALAKDSFSAESKRENTVRRIAFADYMIKPIQRICKYPLLFDQLLLGKSLRLLPSFPDARSDVDVVVESAAQAMRHVASSVDEARHRQDAAIQSSLIFSRILLGSQSLSASNHNPFHTVTPEFLSSVGTCLLAGALDVMHHHPLRPLETISTFKAKYLGAFLYPGGYLILAKVSKGRKYEPKHWFSLADFIVCGIEECDSMLPFSFRVSCGDQHFELAAACQREKDVWLSSIKESLMQTSVWLNEPTPSFKFDDKGALISSLNSEDDLSETSSGLPTIQSIPELSNNSDTELSEPFFASLRGNPKARKKMRRYEVPTKSETSPSNSRRSSSTSVKAIFGPMGSDAETIVIRRSSPMARLQIDQGLQDVVSQSCLTARMYAFSREEELFQAHKPLRSGFPRSSSGMSMAGMAKNRLSKHESIRVSRSRTTDNLDSLFSKISSNNANLATRRNTKKLSITSISVKEYNGKLVSRHLGPPSYPLLPASQSSKVPSEANSEAAMSTTALLTPPIISSADNSPLKSPRSLVRGVKDLFNFRPIPPPSTLSQSSPFSCRVADSSAHNGPGMLHRWTMDSIRRRPRSAPGSSEEFVPETIPETDISTSAPAATVA